MAGAAGCWEREEKKLKIEELLEMGGDNVNYYGTGS